MIATSLVDVWSHNKVYRTMRHLESGIYHNSPINNKQNLIQQHAYIRLFVLREALRSVGKHDIRGKQIGKMSFLVVFNEQGVRKCKNQRPSGMEKHVEGDPMMMRRRGYNTTIGLGRHKREIGTITKPVP